MNDYRPIYLQLAEECRKRILSGIWETGNKIPAVRDISAEFGINPNTVQRALGLLEQEGLLNTRGTAGRFVTDDINAVLKAKEKYGRGSVKEICGKLAEIGIDKKQIILWLEEEHK